TSIGSAWGSTWLSCCGRSRRFSGAAGRAEPRLHERAEALLEGGAIEPPRRRPQPRRREAGPLQAIERGPQRLWRRLGEEDARLAVADRIERSAGGEGDHRPPGRQRLDGDDAEVVERRMDHRAALRVEREELVVAHAAPQLDVRTAEPGQARPFGAVADHD